MLDAAQQHYLDQAALARATAARAAQLWRSHLDPQDLGSSWKTKLARPLLSVVTAAQASAAGRADTYVDAALAEQDIPTRRAGDITPSGFAGTASDGRSLTTLLLEPVIAVKQNLAQGRDLGGSVDAGRASLVRIVNTQVLDAGRTATGAAIVARRDVDGYVRVLTPPSCSRCAILAGRFYRWSSGFARHPRCDCQHVPTTLHRSSALTVDPERAFAAGQITGLSQADTKAIRAGADIGKVVNAHRGMSTADLYGRRLTVTTEAAGKGIRLRPDAIYRLAGNDRDEALRLLRHYGYLT